MSNKGTEKYVYCIRHGQSAANGKDIFQGADTKLTELGKQQASFIAERVRGLDAQALLSSTMPRALETAAAVQETTNLAIEKLDLLHEYLPPSELIGKPISSPAGLAYITQRMEHIEDPDWHYSDEDNYFDLHKRTVKAMELLRDREEPKILVVSHAGFLRTLFTAMMTEGAPDAQLSRLMMRFMRPMNTGVTILHYNPTETIRNKWRLITWNDHAHLAETDVEEPKDYYL